MNHFDAIVVGAGPAGAWAGYTLARAGARVALVDFSHPREKPCGGGVTGRALALVTDAIDVAAMPAALIETARFTDSASGRSATVALEARGVSPASSLVVASRAVFDARLLDAAQRAGATLVAARATDVTVQSGSVRLDTPRGVLHAGLVIGADGANSLVRRRVTRPLGRDQLSIATGYFAHGATSREVVIEITRDPPGYIWSFPRPDHLAIGICGDVDAGGSAAALRSAVAAWIRTSRVAGDARLTAYSWPIPSLHAADFSRLTLAGPRWCLAGDAAGLVDPITREGIFYALQSGAFAANAALSANSAREYSARVHDEIAPELRRAAQWKAGFFRPRFTRLLIDSLQHSAEIRSVMADLVAGRQSYAGLQWRLLKTLEVRLAWQLMRAG